VMSEKVIPTKEKLARAIEAKKGTSHYPRVDRMIKLAREGYYDDYETELDTPIVQLVKDLRAVGYYDLAQRAIDGDFDCTAAEGEAWMKKEGWDYLTGKK